MNPFEQQRPIPGVAFIVAVSSGKGGVGKSTVAANLALAHAKTGARVGLLDADIYGPSQPRMFGAIAQKPRVIGENKIEPLFRYGVKLMSMGFLVDENAALVWRGPMLFKAMEQLLREVHWGELDYLLVDLPPGTGDVQLSLAQKVPVNGAIAVTTPQNVALADVKKSINMFQQIKIPILGVIENMAHFLGPNGEKLEMFPRGEIDTYMKLNDIGKLGEIPFHPQLSAACEVGIPIVESQPSHVISKQFIETAKALRARLG
ncbi:MAG TPA: Mrp/NBP35 family ATP-binding protein [Bdellovibrionales bacterium]|nr:Mrp/NBP35 family ATP-binding protein [Bdellovibrionales bacterium]